MKSRSEGPESGTAEPSEQRSLGQLAVRGGGYLVGREAIGMVIRLAGVVLVVREIGPGPYGIYSAAAAFGVFVATLAQLGLEVYLIRMQGEVGPREYNRAFTLLLASSVLATVVAEGLTFLLGGLIRPVGVLLPLRVLLLAIPVNVLWAPAQAAIERDFRYRLMGMLELGGDVALYATAVPLAFIGAKAWSLVAGYFAWQTWLFFGSLATSGLRLRLDWSISAMKDMTRHGVSYSTAQWVSRLGDLVNPLVVGTFFGATGVGYVAFGARLVDTIAFAKRGAYRLGMVAMSRVAEGDEHRKRYAIEEGSLLQLLSLAVPFACFGVVARWLVPVVFGHEWVRALPVYSLLALATVLGASGFIQTTFLYSARSQPDCHRGDRHPERGARGLGGVLGEALRHRRLRRGLADRAGGARLRRPGGAQNVPLQLLQDPALGRRPLPGGPLPVGPAPVGVPAAQPTAPGLGGLDAGRDGTDPHADPVVDGEVVAGLQCVRRAGPSPRTADDRHRPAGRTRPVSAGGVAHAGTAAAPGKGTDRRAALPR